MVEYFQDKAKKWRFRVKGENGEKIVTSQAYASHSNAWRGANDLRDAVKWVGTSTPPPSVA